MESVFAGGASSSQLILRRRGLFTPPRNNHRIPIAAAKAPFDFRLRENVLKLQTRERWIAVSVSKSNSADGKSIKVKSGGGDAPQGPPFLTILAGFLVMFLVFWVIGSVLMWLINLFVTLPPPK